MESKVKIAGHPIHPMLIAYPVAFYTAALVCYIVYSSKGDPFWFKVALVSNIAGVVMAAVAAIPGFIDWLFIPKASGAKRTGVFHLICNVVALACYAIVAFTECHEFDNPTPDIRMAIPLTAIGFILTLAAGFLGWTLVQKHHVGVDTTNLDNTTTTNLNINR
jgi:uncharacterized membrane protein